MKIMQTRMCNFSRVIKLPFRVGDTLCITMHNIRRPLTSEIRGTDRDLISLGALHVFFHQVNSKESTLHKEAERR